MTGLYSTMRLTCSQVVEAADRKIPYLIDNYIPTAAVGIMVGDWGIGKSPFVLQLMLSMVSNIPFLGRYPAQRQGLKAMYVDIENNANQFKYVVSRLQMHLGLPSLPGVEFTAMGDAYSPRPEGLDGATMEGLVKCAIREDPPDLVIIDPLRGFNFEVETGNEKAAAFIKDIRKLTKGYGTTILFVHHPRKQDPDPTTPRFHLESDPTGWMSNACGAAALVQNVDFRIGIEQLPEEKGGILAMRRHIRGYGWFATEFLDRTIDEEGEPLGYTLTANLEDASMLAHLKNLPIEFKTADLKLVAGLQHNQQVARLLKQYESEGLIERLTKGVYRQSNNASNIASNIVTSIVTSQNQAKS